MPRIGLCDSDMLAIPDLVPPLTAVVFLEKMKSEGVLAAPFGPSTVRFVTHLDVTEEMVGRVVEVLEKFA